METKKNMIEVPATTKPRVVVIGGGFAGLEFVKGLKGKDVQVVIFDRHNYHTFQPLLYQVATAALEPDSIAGPLRKVFDYMKHVYFRYATVTKIIPDENTIETSIGSIRYDYLVIANGSKTNYFGNEAIRAKSFPLKQLPHALDLRSSMLQNFEKAVLLPNKAERQSLMNFVIVGGGPTGVEVAGALSELKKHVLPQDYPEMDFNEMNIYLIEGSGRVLNGMSDYAGNNALHYLQDFGVQVKLNTVVKDYDGQVVTLSDGNQIPTQTLIWAAGVMGNTIEGLSKDAIVKGNRIWVDNTNRVHGYQNIFAIGDIAAMLTDQTPNGHPMVAPVAMQQGSLLASNLTNIIFQRGKVKPFVYNDRGSMATVGRNRAVVDFPGFKLKGFLGWFVWMFVHLISVIGFRNKLVVFANWIWNYFTYDRHTRLIIRPFVKGKDTQSEEAIVQ